MTLLVVMQSVSFKYPALGGYISVFIAPPLFLLAAMAVSDLPSITTFTWKGYALLALAGIIHSQLPCFFCSCHSSSIERLNPSGSLLSWGLSWYSSTR